MALPIYPDRSVLPGLGYSVKWSPVFFNMPTQTTASGADIDLALAQYPLHDFELTYEFLHDWSHRSLAESREFRTLMGFHLMLGGTAGRFLFKNDDDCSVTQQYIGTGDGVTSTFVLQRTFGAGGYSGTEPVGFVDLTQPFNVYLNTSADALGTGEYYVDTSSPVDQLLVFSTPPSLGQKVAVDMSYLYYCKLGANSLTFEKFMDRLWLLNKIQLHSCRPGA